MNPARDPDTPEIPVPKLPDLSLPDFPKPDIAEIPVPKLPDLNLPDFPKPDIPTIPLPKLPEIPVPNIPDIDLLNVAERAHKALADFEHEIARVHGERGQRGTADLLGVAHTTYARWMRGGLSEKLCRVVERLEAVVERLETREYPEPPEPEPEPGLKYQKIEVSSERVVRKGGTIVIYLPEPSGDPDPPREAPEPPPAPPF